MAADKMLYNVYDSPFVELKTPLTKWEIVKMLIMLPTLPFRIALLVFAVFAVAFVNSIATYGCDLEQPLPRWRRRLVEVSSSGFNRLMLFSAGFWMPRVTGLEHWEEGKRVGAIGVFNHVSYIDAFVVTWSLCPAGLTFQFVTEIPVLGRAIRALQNLYVQQGVSMVDLVKKRASMRGMPPLVIAPEGTLSHGRCLLTFKTGAFVAGLPVVPILFRYKLTGHNPGWGVIHPKWHLLRLMTQVYNHILVEVLPLYYPSEDEKANPQLYASNVRKLMGKHLGVPLVDEDRTISQALEKAGVRPSYDGRRVTARPGVVIDENGCIDLAPWLALGDGANKVKKAQ